MFAAALLGIGVAGIAGIAANGFITVASTEGAAASAPFAVYGLLFGTGAVAGIVLEWMKGPPPVQHLGVRRR